MSNYKGTPWAPIESQMDMMRSHSIRPAVRDLKRDTDQHTFILARPPAWSEGVPCIGNYARFDEPTGLKAGEAAARCAGCPVIEACLEAAMEEERGLSAGSRYTIRGGLTPKERAALEFAERECDRGHSGRWGSGPRTLKPICLECVAEDKVRRYAERVEADPDFRARRAAKVRAHRDQRRVTCLMCRATMLENNFKRHLGPVHKEAA